MLENTIVVPVSVDGATAVNVEFRCVERVPGKSVYKNSLFLDGASTLELIYEISKKDPKASGTSLGTRRANIVSRAKGPIVNAVGQTINIDVIHRQEISNPVGTTVNHFSTAKSMSNGFLDSAYANRVLLSLEY